MKYWYLLVLISSLLLPCVAQTWTGQLEPGSSKEFKLLIHPEDWEVRVVLKGEYADLDLSVSRGPDEVARSESDFSNEEVILSYVREGNLTPGSHQITVSCADRTIHQQGKILDAAPFTLTVQRKSGPPQQLEIGTVSDELEALSLPYALYRVKLEGEHQRVSLFSPTADIDLHLVPGELDVEWRARAYSKDGQTGYKSLVLDAEPGEYTLVLVGNLEDRERARYRLWNQVEPEPPLVEPLAPLNGLPGQAQAVVQLLTDAGTFGSGCLVSPQGHILTSYHVLEGINGKALQEGEFTVGWLAKPGELARERFYARVLFEDKEGDLALLRISTDLRGKPVTIDFPHFERAPQPTLGMPIRLLGYPAQGWYHKRPGLTVTSCVLSGFENHPEGTAFKVDSETVGGFSGGAAVDERGRLLGLVRGVVLPFTFVWSLDRVPEHWWKAIAESALFADRDPSLELTPEEAISSERAERGRLTNL